MSPAIILHIIFGSVAFVGSVLMASSFIPKLKSLSKLQKTALALSYVGIIGSTVLGFIPSAGVPAAIGITAIAVLYTAYEFAKAKKSTKINEETNVKNAN